MKSYQLFQKAQFKKVKSIYWTDIANLSYKKKRNKYKQDVNLFCFLSKPYFLKYLLTKYKLASLVYLDADVLCLNNPGILFEKYLLKNHICLTPHYFSKKYSQWKYKSGIYNAGFVGISQKGTKFIDWWKDQCFKKCEWDRSVKPSEGGAVDQGYLEQVPSKYNKVKILGREFNLAVWNILNIRKQNGCIYVGKKPGIFFHFCSHKVKDWKIIKQKELLEGGELFLWRD